MLGEPWIEDGGVKIVVGVGLGKMVCLHAFIHSSQS